MVTTAQPIESTPGNGGTKAEELPRVVEFAIPETWRHLTHARTWDEFFVPYKDKDGYISRIHVNDKPVVTGVDDVEPNSQDKTKALLYATEEMILGLVAVASLTDHQKPFDSRRAMVDGIRMTLDLAGNWHEWDWVLARNKFVEAYRPVPLAKQEKHDMLNVVLSGQRIVLKPSSLQQLVAGIWYTITLPTIEAAQEFREKRIKYASEAKRYFQQAIKNYDGNTITSLFVLDIQRQPFDVIAKPGIYDIYLDNGDKFAQRSMTLEPDTKAMFAQLKDQGMTFDFVGELREPRRQEFSNRNTQVRR